MTPTRASSPSSGHVPPATAETTGADPTQTPRWRHVFRAHPLIAVLGRRWPSWIALTLVADNWQHPSVTSAWVLLILPAGYLLLGGIRGRLRDRRMLVLQLAGLALYLLLILLALNAGPTTAGWLVVGGWGFHALWDAAHHRANAVVPRAYAEWCCVLDSVIALTGALFLLTAA